MGFYLDQFRAAVVRAHDPSGKTCHWCKWREESMSPGGVAGPCSCPSSANGLCPEHGGVDCAATAAIVSVLTKAEMKFSPKLDQLLPTMLELRRVIDNGAQILQQDPSLAQRRWWQGSDNILTDIMRGNEPSILAAGQFICGIELDGPFEFGYEKEFKTRIDPCDCLLNKYNMEGALESLVGILGDLIDDSEKLFQQAASAGFWTSNSDIVLLLSPVTTKLHSFEPNQLFHQFGDDIEQPAATTSTSVPDVSSASSGFAILQQARAAYAIGVAKIISMLAVIYHDQMNSAKTCLVTGAQESHRNGRSSPGGGEDRH